MEGKAGGKDLRMEQNSGAWKMYFSPNGRLLWCGGEGAFGKKWHTRALGCTSMEDHMAILRTIFLGCWLQPGWLFWGDSGLTNYVLIKHMWFICNTILHFWSMFRLSEHLHILYLHWSCRSTIQGGQEMPSNFYCHLTSAWGYVTLGACGYKSWSWE